MSDTSNLASNNVEPSMEDILSSIRKVIAEDLSQKETSESQVVAEVEAEDLVTTHTAIEAETTSEAQTETVDLPPIELASPAETSQDDILELDNLLTDFTDPVDDMGEEMELIQLEDDLDETPTTEEDQEFETLTASPQAPDAAMDLGSLTEQNSNTGFDESLELVMDSDALDYVTEKSAPDFTESSVDENLALETAPEAEAELETSTTTTIDEPIESIFEDILFDEQDQVELEDVTISGVEEIATTSEMAQEPEQDRKPVPNPTQASDNDDMDLVKSLLEDLMDEPVSESVSSAVEAIDTSTVFGVEEAFSEDDLVIPDPVATQSETVDIEELIQASPIPDAPVFVVEESADEQDSDEAQAAISFENTESPESENTESESAVEPENALENELAQIALEIAEARDISEVPVASPDDVVELSAPDYASKLAISASLTGGTVRVDETAEGIITAAAESDLESLQQLIAETDLADIKPETAEIPKATEIPEEIEMLISPIQEEETMATPVKSDVLSDVDTQQEVGNAFASLTTTVQEHALAEENGPPIGELVKEALRPMLQEWLDKNLKAMVQRAVTKEIKRISTGK